MLAILADDLTGALDAAAPFAGRGMRTQVALRAEAVEAALAENPDVLSVNLDCRETTPEAARAAVAAVRAQLPRDVTLFKKVDSRLKGNIAAELDALAPRLALVAPAIPAFGRIVRAGAVEGFGVDTPIPVAAVLGSHAPRCLVPDVTSQGQMDEALAQALRVGVDLLVGARGLAEALARRLTGIDAAVPAGLPRGPGLFVIGSRDPITLAQIETLLARADVAHHAAPNGQLEGGHAEGGRLEAGRAQGLAGGAAPLTLVQAVAGHSACAPEAVAAALAASVVPRLTEAATTWLLSGGATAQAVLLKAGIDGFRLKGECLPGLGVAQAGGRCIIAKSGGFGAADTLTQIAARLH